MIKKALAVLIAFCLSFALLESLSARYNGNDNSCQAEANNADKMFSNYCPFDNKPYKNIKFDFFSKDISTEVDIDSLKAEYAVIDDISVPEEKQTPADKKTGKPKIAIVIDDMGISHKRSLDIISLDAPLTLSFLTYGKGLEQYFELVEDSPFEVMAHIPMEAKTKFDEAPDTLRVADSDYDVKISFNKMLDKFNNIKWVNNHTGSLFTEDPHKMNVIMKSLKERSLNFLDSKTSAKSVGKETAKKYGVKYLSRNVFLDNQNEFNYILGQLKQTEKVAKKYGAAIAIAHPKTQTYKALKHWLATQTEFDVVTLSNI